MVSSLENILTEQDLWISIAQMLLVTGPLFGFIFGAICFYRKKAAFFNQLVVSALGCMMLGRIYELVFWLTAGNLPEGFDLSVLGDVGCFLFLLSASFGQMDGLVDGREKKDVKYRLIPLAAPALILAAGVFLYLHKNDISVIFSDLIIFAVTMVSSYYNLKHLIFPDVDFGILKSIRGYNALTLGGTLSFVLLCVGEEIGNLTLFGIGALLTGLWAFAVIPVLKGGSRKWTL